MANHADTKSDWAQARRQVRKSRDIKPHGLRWQKRNEGRKAKQEAYVANKAAKLAEAEAADILFGRGDPDAEARVSENA
jgi:hypothetical protein